jgi:hypothetical protein
MDAHYISLTQAENRFLTWFLQHDFNEEFLSPGIQKDRPFPHHQNGNIQDNTVVTAVHSEELDIRIEQLYQYSDDLSSSIDSEILAAGEFPWGPVFQLDNMQQTAQSQHSTESPIPTTKATATLKPKPKRSIRRLCDKVISNRARSASPSRGDQGETDPFQDNGKNDTVTQRLKKNRMRPISSRSIGSDAHYHSQIRSDLLKDCASLFSFDDDESCKDSVTISVYEVTPELSDSESSEEDEDFVVDLGVRELRSGHPSLGRILPASYHPSSMDSSSWTALGICFEPGMIEEKLYPVKTRPRIRTRESQHLSWNMLR